MEWGHVITYGLCLAVIAAAAYGLYENWHDKD